MTDRISERILNIRYARWGTPGVSEGDIRKLGKNLRSKVEAGLRIKEAVQARLGVLEREGQEPTRQDYLERMDRGS
jgi:hypothetical protein